jgi:repressor LexA
MRDVGHSQQSLARVFVPRKSQTWVSQYLLSDPARQVALLVIDEPENIERLARALQWSVHELIEKSGAQRFVESLSSSPHTVQVRRYRIPIVDAGAGVPFWNDGDDYVTLDLPELRGKTEAELFAVRVVGDSMSPTFLNGDVVVCWTAGRAESGRVVAVHQHGDGLVLKRMQVVGTGTVQMLYSDNPAYGPSPLGEYDRVYGVALGMWRPSR